MIQSALVEGFRGLRRLEVNGLGRVNLVIGKNDCGKTALLEALAIAEGAEAASHRALFLQALRRGRGALREFERFWRPLFWNQDAERGFSVVLRGSRKEPLEVVFRKAKTPPMTLTEQDALTSSVAPPTWSIEVLIKDGHERREQIVASADTLAIHAPPASGGAWWVQPSKSVGSDEISLFSKLKQNGRERELINVLREIDDRVLGIDVLALTGTDAELFVRFEPGTPLLPLSMMGDGFLRCFEISVAAAAHEWPFLFVDEIDNGLHHSVLEPVWRWIAAISAGRGLQVFATTHSEECIQAACHAFTALDDDGLRVIRLDRRDDVTLATLYDRAMVEAATRMDVEVRG